MDICSSSSGVPVIPYGTVQYGSVRYVWPVPRLVTLVSVITDPGQSEASRWSAENRAGCAYLTRLACRPLAVGVFIIAFSSFLLHPPLRAVLLVLPFSPSLRYLQSPWSRSSSNPGPCARSSKTPLPPLCARSQPLRVPPLPAAAQCPICMSLRAAARS
jgi:hypothetical protein